MMPGPESPLSDAERDQLDAFLASSGGMNFEAMDGFMVALICAPDMVMPSEYLPEIWGEPEFASMEEAQTMMGLVMRHWNTIATTLLGTLKEFSAYSPVLVYDQHGVARGNDWASGFMRGTELRPESWRALFTNDATNGLVMPMMLLADERRPDLITPELPPDKRNELLEFMASAITHIYRYFEPERRRASMPARPPRRAGPKIGRNDPCPCGSGRKYKHCHASSVH